MMSDSALGHVLHDFCVSWQSCFDTGSAALALWGLQFWTQACRGTLGARLWHALGCMSGVNNLVGGSSQEQQEHGLQMTHQADR